MRILLVEDYEEVRNFLKGGLEAESFTVDCAEDGEKGSYLARTNDYDVIVLDNNLPKKNGLEVCRDLRKAGKTCPVVVISVKSDTPSKVALLDNGADDYLTKPFAFEELMARIRALLRRPQGLNGEELRVDDLVLNTKACSVTRAGNNINLTKKEFMLLEYLMRNMGVVLSRGMLLEHVWDMDCDPFTNTLEAHIRSLRRKIENGEGSIIRTVHGRGYTIGSAQKS